MPAAFRYRTINSETFTPLPFWVSYAMTERIAFIGFGEAGETLKGIGIEPIMAAATAARQQWLADLDVKEHIKEGKTENRAGLVRAIRKAMGK